MQELNAWTYHAAKVNNAAFSPNGRLMATCSIDTYVHIWDIEAGYIIHKLKGNYVHKGIYAGSMIWWNKLMKFDWMIKRIIEWMNELKTSKWMNKWMNEWTKEWMNEWMNEGMNEWMNEGTNVWQNEWISE